jgi:hypothetical protein
MILRERGESVNEIEHRWPDRAPSGEALLSVTFDIASDPDLGYMRDVPTIFREREA